MKRIMCARCKQGIEPDKINKITPNTFVCNSCYDELLQVDIRSTNRNMEERHKVLAALTFEEYFPDDEEDYKLRTADIQLLRSLVYARILDAKLVLESKEHLNRILTKLEHLENDITSGSVK